MKKNNKTAVTKTKTKQEEKEKQVLPVIELRTFNTLGHSVTTRPR